jgi:hypothetical protein
MMKNVPLQKLLLLALSLNLAGYANFASAHDASGSLGKAAGATDLYLVSCFDNQDGTGASSRLAFQISDDGPVALPKVSVQVVKGVKAATSTDAIDGDAKFSPFAYNYGGDGEYWLTVSKTGAGIENYSLELHCQSSTGEHTGTNFQLVQNQ